MASPHVASNHLPITMGDPARVGPEIIVKAAAASGRRRSDFAGSST